jgi:hypothetical protein
MIRQDDWADKLADRLLNSPGEDLFVGDCPLEVNGEPHIIGQRITEACALLGRAAKQGLDLAVFLPPPDTIDVLTTVVYLHRLRQAILSGHSIPGPWASLEVTHLRRDIWLLGHVSRLRATMFGRLALKGRSITKELRIGWHATKGDKSYIESIGETHLPAVCLFRPEELLEGSLPAAVEGSPPPFAMVIDATSIEARAKLAQQVTYLKIAGQHAPVFVLGPVGDKGAAIEVCRARVPMFIVRAGDVVRLNEASAKQGMTVAARSSGADLASTRLAKGIRVEVRVLPALATRGIICPLLQAVRVLERVAADQPQLLSRARQFARAVLGVCIPLKLQVDAVAARGRAGRFATHTLETRLQSLRETETSTGETAGVLQRLLENAEHVVAFLREPSCVTSKQSALLQETSTAHAESRTLWVVCANEITQQAVQTFLGDHNIDVLTGVVRIVTRSQFRRAVAAGIPTASELLLIDPLAFNDGFYFSGIASLVRLHVYEFERGAVERQLRSIAHDTQCTSARGGDKRDCVVGATAVRPTDCVPMDIDVEDDPPLWRVQWTAVDDGAVLPVKLPEVEPFFPPESDWLQKVLDEAERGEDADVADTHWEQGEEGGVPAHATTYVSIELDDQEKPALLPPDSSVVLLDDLEETETGSVLARDARVGMMILIARRDVGPALMERLLEPFETSAHYLVAKQFRQMWQDGVAVLVQQAKSAPDALALLAQHGVGVTTSGAVRHWMRGLVLGPRVPESIQALGRATGRAELTRHHDKIFAAIGYIRQLHVALKRKLFEYASTGKSRGPYDVVDQRLGLRRADLQEITRIGRVTKVTLVSRQGA